MKNHTIKTLLTFLFIFDLGTTFAAQIVFVRHAETELNASYGRRRENVLTPKGEEQAAQLVDKLSGYDFDAIWVSPKGRTQITIRPYLESQDLQDFAITRPELTECCWNGQAALERQAATAQLKAIALEISKTLAGTDKTLLIVGHSMSGERLLRFLGQRPSTERIHIKNAHPYLLKETSPGVFWFK